MTTHLLNRTAYVALLIAAAVLTVPPAHGQSSPLNRAGVDLTPVSLSSSDLGDIDGDGDLDLVVTGLEQGIFGAQTAILYRNDGAGQFSRVNAGLTGIVAGSADFGDVDGDGDPDLLVTGEAGFTPSATLYENDGNGNFSEMDADLTGVQNGNAAFGDIDGDDDQDLIVTGVTNTSDASTTVYRNDGNGNYSSIDAGVADVHSASLDFGDVDDDEDQDLVITGRDGNSNDTAKLFENDGNGNFSAMNEGLTAVGSGSSHFGDVDGDDDLDLVVTGSGTATLYKNDGSGAFSAANAGLTSVSNSASTFRDIDTDGDLDLIVTGRADDTPSATLYKNDGQGNFSSTQTSLSGVIEGSSNVGDIDGDDDPDLVLTGQDLLFGASARLYINNTVQSGPNRAPQANQAPTNDTTAAGLTLSTSVEVGDPDGDAVSLTLTQGSSVSGAAFTDRGNGTGTFQFMPPRSQSGNSVSFTIEASDGAGKTTDYSFSVRVPNVFAAANTGVMPLQLSASAFGDIDSDGDQDLVVTGRDTTQTAQALLYESDGQGGFSPLNAGLTGVEDGSADFGDIDGDGDLDLLITGGDEFLSATATIYENDGTGSFSALDADLNGVRAGSSAEFGDVDGDGDQDLVIAGSSQSLDPTATLYINDGSGSFSVAGANLGGIEDGSVDLGDVDTDGDLDLLLTGSAMSTLYLNDGNGNFSQASVPFQGVNKSDADFGDIDGDGDLDLILVGAAPFNPGISLYTNDGSGAFTEQNTPVTPVANASVRFADIDSDEQLELLVAGENSDGAPTMRLYENDGMGNFSPAGAGLSVGATDGDISVGDGDGDGNYDVVVSGESSVGSEATIYENLRADAVTASVSKTVDADGTVDFGATGVDIEFFGTSGSGSVLVKKLDTPPSSTAGISATHVSSYRFLIEAGGGLSFDSTALHMDQGTLAGLPDPTQVTVHNRSVQGQGSFSALATTHNSGAGTLVVSPDHFSEFVLSSDSQPLPVEIARFRATMDDGSVHLTWRTVSETNNAGFQIQRTTGSPAPTNSSASNEATWTPVGSVEGTGTTSTPQSYRFTDSALPYEADRLTYRLKQVDADGTTSYSRTVTVRRGIEAVRFLALSPNPVHQDATVRFAVPERQEIRITLYDVLGRQVRTVASGKREGRHQVRLDASELPSGVYFLHLKTQGTTKTRRITVLR